MHDADPGSLASELERQLKDKHCVVNLKRGEDHLGMARMEVEKIYVDDGMPHTTVFRVVGRHTHGTDHAMLGLPMGHHDLTAMADGEDITLRAGEFEMHIHPGESNP